MQEKTDSILQKQWTWFETWQAAARAAQAAAHPLGLLGDMPFVFDAGARGFTFGLTGWDAYLGILHGWPMVANYSIRGWLVNAGD